MLSPGPRCDPRMLILHLKTLWDAVLLHTGQPLLLSVKATKIEKRWVYASSREEGAKYSQGCLLAGSRDKPSTARQVPQKPPPPQPPLACFPNPADRVSRCWRGAKAPGQQGEGIPRQDTVPRTARTAHLPFSAPKTRGKPLGRCCLWGKSAASSWLPVSALKGCAAPVKPTARVCTALGMGGQAHALLLSTHCGPSGITRRLQSAAGLALVLGALM